MNLKKQDVMALEEIVTEKLEMASRELSEIELALIGGGHGDVSFG